MNEKYVMSPANEAITRSITQVLESLSHLLLLPVYWKQKQYAVLRNLVRYEHTARCTVTLQITSASKIGVYTHSTCCYICN